ncbi:PREDICTED: increased DNA methylation 1 isoform X1 [Ipomoea nil]|uniref:increased DNA methylation 1 isoform X1 n=1 Tax=Ipomoea nil TaxID=35883 RepID=UPI0009010381|nr:PREDICTED: increased DNA methylation 1 isoform X1 [Ipomoea nil]
MKLGSDVALEALPELADSEVQIRDVQEQESGVDNPVGANMEINGTASIGELSSVRFRDSKGIVVYTRSKRLKTAAATDGGAGLSGLQGGRGEGTSEMRCGGDAGNSNELNLYLDGNGVTILGKSGLVTCNGDGKHENVNLVSDFSGEGEMSEMVEVEVKEESTEVVKNAAGKLVLRRFTRSAFQLKVEVASETENEDVVEAVGDENGVGTALGTPTKKLEMKMSKKIVLKGKPSTVRELFETGLLEGYPVVYNAGKRGVLLRGIIKDVGILCSCGMCKGSIVVPPCKFEIHACKSYRRASQYICLENGKSLLDVVKECRKCSLKTLEETIHSFIGPAPVKEAIVCQNCKVPFLTTSAANLQLCDSCLIVTRSEDEVGTSEPVENLHSLASVKFLASSMVNTKGRKKRKALDLASNGKAPLRSSERILPRQKDLSEMSKMSKKGLSEPAFVSKATGNASKHYPFKKKMKGRILKKFSKSNAVMKYAKGSTAGTSIQTKNQWKITKKDQKMHWMVFEEGGLPDGTEVAYYSHGKKLLVGYKTGFGIFCSCCNTEISPSQFEAHAGWASRKKPYMYIYTSNGVSLHEFAISLLKGRNSSVKNSDDLCITCADGGKLVLCDGCPRAFHKGCASLPSVPRGKWYCKYCENMFQREKFVEHNANALAAGRVSGIDLIEQITKRCIRIVKNPEEAEVIACVICRGYDFSRSGFGPRTVILCDQCEREYHIGCLKKHKMADLKELPKGKWFCCTDCKRIYLALQNLLNSGDEKLPDTCLDIVRAKEMEKGIDSIGDTDVRWRLLSGKMTSRETRVLLAEAVAIFHDCFDPIVDSVTGRDFIPSMVYGRNIRGQDFGGMYCAILTLNSTVVSAAILRVFGRDTAEIPLVATRIGNQGKGYFQLLFSCIEKLFAFLNVKTCVLPAADEAISIWTEKFGFKKIPPDQLASYRRICWQMITFKGTSMLEKMVPKCRIIRQEEVETETATATGAVVQQESRMET